MKRGAAIRGRVPTVAAGALAVLMLAGTAHAAPGDPDPTYGNGGVRVVRFDGLSSEARGMARMPDGGVVLAGNVGLGLQELALARLKQDGRPHKGFGNNGRLVTDSGYGDEFFDAVAVHGNRVFAVVNNDSGDPSDARVMAFSLTGVSDTSFGVGGIASVDFGGDDFGQAIAVDPQGRVLVAAKAVDPQSGDGAVGVARLTPSGAPDLSYGNNGRRRVVFQGGSASVGDMVIRPGGGVAVAGSLLLESGGRQAIVAALTPSGGVDTSFSGDGRFTFGAPDAEALASSIVVRQGKLLVAGASGADASDTDGFVLRLTVGGSLDPLFGNGGVTTVILGPGQDGLVGIAVLPDGRLVAVGTASDGLGAAVILRLTPGGDLDPSFGQGGMAPILSLSSVADVILDGTGRPVVGGSAGSFPDIHMAAARFQI